MSPTGKDLTMTYYEAPDEVFCPSHGEECEGWHEPEDTRDFDSMPGGWDYED